MRKTVVRIVLVLSVLTLAGIAALATAGHHGIVTSRDGRMAIATRGASQVTPWYESAGHTPIAGNISTDAFGKYFCCYGYTISGPNSFLKSANWVAIPFTPSANYTVNRVEVSVGWGGDGTNGVTVSLNADFCGLPGAVLASTDATGLQAYGDCCALVIGQDNAGVPVTQGTQYWVVVGTDTTTETTFDAWAFNSTDMRFYPYAYYSTTNGTWRPDNGLLPGYAVFGQ
jgi:hypothetical protein